MRSLLLLSVAVAACAAPPPPDALTKRSVRTSADEPIYSPFVVRLQSDAAPFSVISFKDVGMSLPDDERELVYESLAEGLAMELAPMSSQVTHSPSMADPSQHLACEGEHIYVDLWQQSQGWGYSLWSGCGQADRFGQHEVSVSVRDDRVASIDSLSTHIASRLREAVRTGCFTRDC